MGTSTIAGRANLRSHATIKPVDSWCSTWPLVTIKTEIMVVHSVICSGGRACSIVAVTLNIKRTCSILHTKACFATELPVSPLHRPLFSLLFTTACPCCNAFQYTDKAAVDVALLERFWCWSSYARTLARLRLRAAPHTCCPRT